MCECDCYSKEEIDALLENVAYKTAPVEFNLPLAPGIATLGTCTYFKTQENIVYVNLYVHKEDDSSFAVNDIIGYIPDGFRPRMPAGGLVTTDSYPVTGKRSIARVGAGSELMVVNVLNLTNAKLLVGQLCWLALD